MSKKNMWISVVVVIIVVAGVVYAVAHKSKDNGSGGLYGNTISSQTSSTSSNTANKSTSSDIVTTKTDPSAGEFLADGSGKPLYTYGSDTNGVSNCTGACLVSWPIYGPASSSSSLPANVTVIQRSDGKAQYAYKGMPLYYFTADSGGTPSGDNVSGFHLAKP